MVFEEETFVRLRAALNSMKISHTQVKPMWLPKLWEDDSDYELNLRPGLLQPFFEFAQYNFYRFPEFPLEIRGMIWRACILPRVVNIDLSSWCHPVVRQREETAPAATLLVNQESRSETQLLFHAIEYKKYAATGFAGVEQSIGMAKNVPLLINPKQDLISFSFEHLTKDQFREWISFIDKSLPGGTATIRNLEIRDCKYERARKLTTEELSSQPQSQTRQRMPQTESAFSSFRGLSRITFGFDEGYCPLCKWGSLPPVRECLTHMLEAFEWDKGIPEIQFKIDWVCCGKNCEEMEDVTCELEGCHMCHKPAQGLLRTVVGQD